MRDVMENAEMNDKKRKVNGGDSPFGPKRFIQGLPFVLRIMR